MIAIKRSALSWVKRARSESLALLTFGREKVILLLDRFPWDLLSYRLVTRETGRPERM